LEQYAGDYNKAKLGLEQRTYTCTPLVLGLNVHRFSDLPVDSPAQAVLPPHPSNRHDADCGGDVDNRCVKLDELCHARRGRMWAMEIWLMVMVSPLMLVLFGAIIIEVIERKGRFSLRALLIFTAILALLLAVIRVAVVTYGV
jgi:hypothetical protein